MKTLTSLENYEQYLSLVGLAEKQAQYIMIVDQHTLKNGTRLVMLHYSPEALNLDVEELKSIEKIRGTILNLDTRDVIPTFPYTQELTVEDFKLFDTQKISATLGYDGTVLRSWTASPTEMFLSTFKKIDASKSSWGMNNKSFGELYQKSEILTPASDFDDENEKTVFAFLLQDPNNVLVCRNTFKTPTLRLIARGVIGELNFPFTSTLTNIEKELAEIVEKESHNNGCEYSGIFFVAPNGRRYKVVTKMYEYYRKLRNNSPDLWYRWVDLFTFNRKSSETNFEDFQNFEKLYRENFAETIDEYNNRVDKLVKKLANIYQKRIIEKRYIRLEKEENFVILRTSNLYNECLTENKLTLENVILNVLQTSNPGQLVRMINRC